MLIESIIYIAMSDSLTYTKDTKPIFEQRCSQCHNSTWPDKNWMDYETAKKNKNAIKIKVKDQLMPPGNMTNMTTQERDIMIKWVDQGANK